jgi:hypothetical protein
MKRTFSSVLSGRDDLRARVQPQCGWLISGAPSEQGRNFPRRFCLSPRRGFGFFGGVDPQLKLRAIFGCSFGAKKACQNLDGKIILATDETWIKHK